MTENGEAPKFHESPKCAVCDADPMSICSKTLPASNGLVLGLVWCANCGILLSATVIGQQQPMQLPHLRGGGKGPLII
jgi:hypothetical protein